MFYDGKIERCDILNYVYSDYLKQLIVITIATTNMKIEFDNEETGEYNDIYAGCFETIHNFFDMFGKDVTMGTVQQP